MSSLIEAFRALPLAEGLNFHNALSPQWWLSYAVKAYADDPIHVLVESALFFIVIWLLFRPTYDPKQEDKLSEQEEDSLIAEWKPDPLVEGVDAFEDTPPIVVDSAVDAKVIVNGKQMKNFSSNSFLAMAIEKEVKEACKATVEKYGVGSCGPRGFYGSIDVHLKLEKDIADFYGLSEAIIYSDGIACVSSVIPAFSKRGDLLICDEGVHFGIQQGITLCKSNVLYFKHNDMEDLERVLQDVRERDLARPPKKLNRRFIIIEGLYQNHGDVAPLDKVVELKKKYKYRLILDDGLAVGVLGATGRGSPEHFSVKMADIDILCGSVDAALGSVGGFCVGVSRVVDHQRLSGAGYCFSASAPPYTCTAGSVALAILQREPKRVARIRDRAKRLRTGLKSIGGITYGKDDISPLVHVRLHPSKGAAQDRAILREVERKLRERGILANVPDYIPSERKAPVPSLRLSVMTNHTDEDIDECVQALKTALQSVTGGGSTSAASATPPPAVNGVAAKKKK
jgi:serine palmitoyltransferase